MDAESSVPKIKISATESGKFVAYLEALVAPAAERGDVQLRDTLVIIRAPALPQQLDIVKEPRVIASEVSILFGNGSQGGHLLKIWEDWWVLDVDQEVDDQQDVAVGGESALVRRIYLPSFAPYFDCPVAQFESRDARKRYPRKRTMVRTRVGSIMA